MRNAWKGNVLRPARHARGVSRTLAPALVAALLVPLLLAPVAAASEQAARVFVYCDGPPQCGVSQGDRDSNCHLPGNGPFTTCSYGTPADPLKPWGVGVWVYPSLPNCDGNPYCHGVGVVSDPGCLNDPLVVRVFGWPLPNAVSVCVPRNVCPPWLCSVDPGPSVQWPVPGDVLPPWVGTLVTLP